MTNIQVKSTVTEDDSQKSYSVMESDQAQDSSNQEVSSESERSTCSRESLKLVGVYTCTDVVVIPFTDNIHRTSTIKPVKSKRCRIEPDPIEIKILSQLKKTSEVTLSN